ncbi:hypothetical protein [Mesorhizobium sp. M0816]|uniref:hypothetical protein n=1 Tax=Mesorhizobium sp. M0816 TaxID=2957006 RepID=UPI0033350713
MATDVYKYKLVEKAGGHTIWILCNDSPGPFNDWEEGDPQSGCLIITSGPLKTDNAGQHCMSGGAGSQEVLVLQAAAWSTNVGDTGDAELFLSQNSTTYYAWEMVEKSSS